MSYAFSKKTKLSFDEAIQRAKEELQKENFGVLTEIDVKKTMKEKLGEDFERYSILGACNPPFALKALKEEKMIGLLLPCNVVVYEHEGGVEVSAIIPSVAMEIVKNPNIENIAKEIEEKLEKVVNSIPS